MRKFYAKKQVYTVKGTVIEIWKDKNSLSRIVQGIGKKDQRTYNNNHNYHGSNGTYRFGYPEVNRYLQMQIKIDGYGIRIIDIRNQVLEVNERKNITNAFIEKLRTKLNGKPIKLLPYVNDFELYDINDLSVS